MRSEISTWRVVLAVTFGILCEEIFFWTVNPSKRVTVHVGQHNLHPRPIMYIHASRVAVGVVQRCKAQDICLGVL